MRITKSDSDMTNDLIKARQTNWISTPVYEPQ